MSDFVYIGELPQSQNYVSDITLRIEIKNNKPVDLIYLTDSFISLSHEYKRHLSEHGKPFNAETRLYVKEIKTGSIITDLVNLTPVAMAIAPHIDSIVDFVGYVKTAYGYYSKLIGNKPNLDKNSLKNLSSVINPIAKDNASQMNIGAINMQSGAVINFYNMNSDEANTAQNRIQTEMDDLSKTESKLRKKVALSIHQAVNGSPSASDKGIIENISPKPLKILWDDEAKNETIHMDKNFFNISILVDCEVLMSRGAPVAYKILKIHEILE